MAETQPGTFRVDFESLIMVLGENLYANPKAAVRELIQNASDSCVRRQAAGQTFRPRIQITAQHDERVLVFEDNGAPRNPTNPLFLTNSAKVEVFPNILFAGSREKSTALMRQQLNTGVCVLKAINCFLKYSFKTPTSQGSCSTS